MFTLPGCTSVSFALILAMLEITVHDFVVKMVARVYECMSPWLAEALERYPSYVRCPSGPTVAKSLGFLRAQTMATCAPA